MRYGLEDRVSLLDSLSRVAAALCACVDIAPPADHLTAKHNRGVAISRNIGWSYFFNITFSADGTPALCSDRVATTSAKSPDDLSSGKNATVMRFTPAFQRPWTLHTGFSAAVERACAGASVVWSTRMNSASGLREGVDRLATPQLKTGMRLQSSTVTLGLVKAFTQRAQLDSGFYHVHLRRTDRSQYCDSSPERVERVIKCKFGNLTAISSRGEPRAAKSAHQAADHDADHAAEPASAQPSSRTTHVAELPLVVFTDDRNNTYLSRLERALTPLFPRVVLGDAMLRSLRGSEANNYLVYNAINVLQTRSRFGIKFKGGVSSNNVCPSCTKPQSSSSPRGGSAATTFARFIATCRQRRRLMTSRRRDAATDASSTHTGERAVPMKVSSKLSA